MNVRSDRCTPLLKNMKPAHECRVRVRWCVCVSVRWCVCCGACVAVRVRCGEWYR